MVWSLSVELSLAEKNSRLFKSSFFTSVRLSFPGPGSLSREKIMFKVQVRVLDFQDGARPGTSPLQKRDQREGGGAGRGRSETH